MNKQTTVRAVARKTGRTYFEVQTILEAILTVWAEELANKGQIALQDFLTIKVTKIKTHQRGNLRNHTADTRMIQTAYRVDTRISQNLRHRIRKGSSDTRE
ncbi:MAG: HU family DNA-binding protein [Chloroflexi bacterium]|nr:HU family DNA-binding protein [Chloroflexota bacterium]